MSLRTVRSAANAAWSRDAGHSPYRRTVSTYTMLDPILVREWTAAAFHRRVLELEARGYVTRHETYRITPEMHPETGVITLLHTVELLPPESNP